MAFGMKLNSRPEPSHSRFRMFFAPDVNGRLALNFQRGNQSVLVFYRNERGVAARPCRQKNKQYKKQC